MKNKIKKILGVEVIRDIKNGDRKLYNKYRKKADDLGYDGPVRMSIEDGKIIFYIILG